METDNLCFHNTTSSHAWVVSPTQLLICVKPRLPLVFVTYQSDKDIYPGCVCVCVMCDAKDLVLYPSMNYKESDWKYWADIVYGLNKTQRCLNLLSTKECLEA